jgi:hypothetical protein
MISADQAVEMILQNLTKMPPKSGGVSHQIWYSPTGHRLSIQEGRDGKAKGYQVEQFITQFESENENGDD